MITSGDSDSEQKTRLEQNKKTAEEEFFKSDQEPKANKDVNEQLKPDDDIRGNHPLEPGEEVKDDKWIKPEQ